MKTSNPTKLSYILALLVPVSLVGVLVDRVGTGDHAIYPIALMLFLPFALGAVMAWGVRGKPFLRWIVLIGILAASIDGAIGLHSAFFRIPARGALDLIYRPIGQTALMTCIAVSAALSHLIKKSKFGKPDVSPPPDSHSK